MTKKLYAFLLLFFTIPASVAQVVYYPHPSPKAPFSIATQVDNIVYLSGQIGMGEDGKLADNITDQSHQVMKNVAKAAKVAGVTLDDVFKCTVMIDDIEQWPAFNEVYVTYFKPGKLPARSAFGADGLAMGSMLEVECWAYKMSM